MTTRRTRSLDRIVTLLVGFVLLALGLAAWEWRLDVTGRLSPTLRTDGADAVLDSGWWPWAWCPSSCSAARCAAAPAETLSITPRTSSP